MPITPDQSRAGRALIQMSRADLAAEAGVTERTITDFERRAHDKDGEIRAPRKSTLLALQAALQSASVVFIEEIVRHDHFGRGAT